MFNPTNSYLEWARAHSPDGEALDTLLSWKSSAAEDPKTEALKKQPKPETLKRSLQRKPRNPKLAPKQPPFFCLNLINSQALKAALWAPERLEAATGLAGAPGAHASAPFRLKEKTLFRQ